MFRTKHIPKIILKISLAALSLAILLFVIYLVALVIGVDFQSKQRLLLGLISTGVVLFGVFISILTGAAMAENFLRRQCGDYQFVCISRFGSSVSYSFIWSQLLMAVGCGVGVYAIYFGATLLIRALPILFVNFW
jgi:hypothetical protein